MHLIKDTEVHYRDLFNGVAHTCISKIDYFLSRPSWSVSKNLIVLPPGYSPDFFLGLCLVEVIKVPINLKICSSDDYYETIDKDNSIDSVFTLAVKI